MSSTLRIGFLTSWDARDPTAVSGTPYHMARALRQHVGAVEYLGPVTATREVLGRLRSGASLALRGRRVPYHHSLALSREYARRFAARLDPGLDLIFAPFGSTQIAHLETAIPIVYASDATVELLRDYHPGFTGLGESYLAEAQEVERRALQRAALALYPSEWAAHSARHFYGVPSSRVEVVPFGANLEEVPARERVLRGKSTDPCVVTLLGVNWGRKGGPVALGAVKALRERGVDARFVVCGCEPDVPLDPEYCEVVPRLDKRRPEERRSLSELLLRSTFLVLPTRNDCYGIVFCEASAHGTPSLASRTGGVPGAVVDGENGFLLPLVAGPEAYAEQMAELLRDPARYATLVASSRAAYEERLNWDAWGRRVREVVQRVV